MFVLAEMTDVVRTFPGDFKAKLNDAIADELNRKLSNKVVYKVGLCMLLYDILKIEESFIFPGDGSTHTKVAFRFIVFRPFVDEVLYGTIKTSNSEGIFVSMSFFDDIFIPGDCLQTTSKFDQSEQLWFWEYKDDDGNVHPLNMELGEQIRFRVNGESFTDTSPTGPKDPSTLNPVDKSGPSTSTTGSSITSATASTSGDLGTADEKRVPYLLKCTINEPGLGLLSWWT